MTYPLVGDLAADGTPVAVTCRVLGFSKQAYYAWRSDPVSQRYWDDAYLINAALDIHHDDPAFGYRFIADELPAHGITAGANRVARLCSQQRIFPVFSGKKCPARRGGPPVHDDHVRRVFTADAPNTQSRPEPLNPASQPNPGQPRRRTYPRTPPRPGRYRWNATQAVPTFTVIRSTG